MFTKKKIVTFMLLLAVAAPLLFSSGFLINKEWLQHKAMERLEQDQQLLSITTPISGVTWIEQDKEVIINGRLFDVKSADTHGDEITLTGFFDEDEDKLNKNIKDLLKQDDEGACTEDEQVPASFSFPINTHCAHFTINGYWQYIAHSYGKFAENIPSSPSLPYILPPKLH